MILFLTSSPTGNLDGSYTCIGLDTRNGFSRQLKQVWKEQARVLMITASPDNPSGNAKMMVFFREALEKTPLSFQTFDLWDGNTLRDTALFTKEQLHSYDVIFLGGGHVPTQQQFFEKLNLREHMQDFDGIVIGISAGTMNSADLVYAQPEEPGEATDPAYRRFIPGLGLTKLNILPHYQLTKDFMLDGKKLFEEVTYPDSMGKEFLALPDGSYCIERIDRSTDARTTKVVGEAFLLKDGILKTICQNGEEYLL